MIILLMKSEEFVDLHWCDTLQGDVGGGGDRTHPAPSSSSSSVQICCGGRGPRLGVPSEARSAKTERWTPSLTSACERPGASATKRRRGLPEARPASFSRQEHTAHRQIPVRSPTQSETPGPPCRADVTQRRDAVHVPQQLCRSRRRLLLPRAAATAAAGATIATAHIIRHMLPSSPSAGSSSWVMHAAARYMCGGGHEAALCCPLEDVRVRAGASGPVLLLVPRLQQPANPRGALQLAQQHRRPAAADAFLTVEFT
jgi:hypothetical protein